MANQTPLDQVMVHVAPPFLDKDHTLLPLPLLLYCLVNMVRLHCQYVVLSEIQSWFALLFTNINGI